MVVRRHITRRATIYISLLPTIFMIAEIIQYVDDIIIPLIPYFSMVLAGGVVLYFDGIIFSGGKGWVKGLENTFKTLNKGFLYFLANIIAMLVAGYFLQVIIQSILLRYRTYFLPVVLQSLLLIYVYYLHMYSKKGFLRLNVIIFQIIVVIIFYIFYTF